MSASSGHGPSDARPQAAPAGAPAGPAVVVRLRGIGLLGPGLDGWGTGRARLADPAGWTPAPAPAPLPPPARLPPAERRRSGAIVKLSLAVAEQAVAMAGADVAALATVFSSSSGDPANCHALCEALATPERAVSPTRFTNSVHNAPAGYWHIGCASRAPSTSLCALDASFGAGLLEAAVQCATAARPVLLVCAEVPYPEPLAAARPLPEAFGTALLLEPCGGDAGTEADEGEGAVLSLWLEDGDMPPTGCADPRLDALRRGVPAARSLPLLQALAGGAAGAAVRIDGLAGAALRVRLETAPRWSGAAAGDAAPSAPPAPSASPAPSDAPAMPAAPAAPAPEGRDPAGPAR